MLGKFRKQLKRAAIQYGMHASSNLPSMCTKKWITLVITEVITLGAIAEYPSTFEDPLEISVATRLRSGYENEAMK